MNTVLIICFAIVICAAGYATYVTNKNKKDK